MSPIWVIAKREFTQNILSLRLLIGLVICLALFVASTYVLIKDYKERFSVHNAAEIEHQNALEEVKVFSHLRVDVAKPPEPLSVICLGMERQLGSTVKVSYEDVPTEAKVLGGGNPLLTVFSAVDAVLMVQIAFSLFVISIAYDVICGERESGTLALVASNPVSKYHWDSSLKGTKKTYRMPSLWMRLNLLVPKQFCAETTHSSGLMHWIGCSPSALF